MQLLALYFIVVSLGCLSVTASIQMKLRRDRRAQRAIIDPILWATITTDPEITSLSRSRHGSPGIKVVFRGSSDDEWIEVMIGWNMYAEVDLCQKARDGNGDLVTTREQVNGEQFFVLRSLAFLYAHSAGTALLLPAWINVLSAWSPLQGADKHVDGLTRACLHATPRGVLASRLPITPAAPPAAPPEAVETDVEPAPQTVPITNNPPVPVPRERVPATR